MLSATRRFAKTPVAWVIIVLLIISFGFFGVEYAFDRGISNAVVSAGSRSVSARTYRARIDRVLEEASQQQGRPVTLDEAVKAGVDRGVLQQLALRESVSELLHRVGLRPSSQLVVNQLRSFTAFFDPVTGKFDTKAYQQKLGEVGLTRQDFEQEMVDAIREEHFVSGLQAGFQAPRLYGALSAISAFESRSLSFFTVDQSNVEPPPAPTDAQLTQLMNENAEALRKPELRTLSVVRFSTGELATTMPVDAAELQRLFEFRKDSLSQPELRSVIQIPAKDRAQAQAAAARLTKGEDPSAVARSIGVEPVVHDNKPKSAIVDRKVADAAFSLPAGQVSGPIQGDLGFAVVKVIDVKPGREATLEEARVELEEQVKRNAAQRVIREQYDKFEDAQNNGATLEEAARAAGVTPSVVGPVAENGRNLEGQVAPGATPKMVSQAFDLDRGETGNIEEETPGEYYAVRVDAITPAAMPPLAEVRERLTDEFLRREAEKRMRAKADELAARIRKGEAPAAAAQSIGATMTLGAAISRSNAPTYQNRLGAAGLSALFNGTRNEVFVAPAPTPGFIVGRIESITAGGVEEMARAAEQDRRAIGQELVGELVQQSFAAARRIIEPNVNVERARAALGLGADEAAPETKEKAK